MPPRKPVEPDAPEPEGEPEVEVEAEGPYVPPPGAIPYEIDGRHVTQHEYAEWLNEQHNAEVLADLQAAAEGRGEPIPQPPEEE